MINRTFLLFMISLPLMAQDEKIDPKKFLALGDSYTIGESVNENERWPNQLADALRSKGIAMAAPEIIARTGWRTDELKNAILAADPAKDFDLVSLLIGVNNQYQGKPVEDYAREFEELLKTAITLAGGDREKVFVVSIPDYGYTPFGKDRQGNISAEIDKYNNINRAIAGKHGVKYFYITSISRNGLLDPELVASDNLHPSGKMYRQWADLISAGLF